MHIELVHNTFYTTGGIYVDGGLRIYYTDGTAEVAHYTATSTPDEWHTFDIISNPAKTIRYVNVYYYTSQIVYITTDSYIVENTEGFHETGTVDAPEVSTIGMTDGLIGYWKLDDNVKDYSGNGYHGTNNGAVSEGSSYAFNDNSNIVLPTLPELSEFTILVKLKRTANSNWDGIFGTEGSNLHFQLETSGRMNCYLYDGVGLGLNSGTNYITADGEWHLAVLTYDGTNITLYKDNILDATIADPSPGGVIYSTYTWRIGMAHDTSRYFNGNIAYAKLFNHALTHEQIAIEYNTMINNELQIHKNGTVFAKDIRQY